MLTGKAGVPPATLVSAAKMAALPVKAPFVCAAKMAAPPVRAALTGRAGVSPAIFHTFLQNSQMP